MKKWTKEIEINAPIEQVWELFNGSLENMQKIMPQVIMNTPIKLTENQIGSIYRQQYKERNRIQEYDVETLDYIDSPAHKCLQVGFSLAKMFEITAFYELFKVSDHTTKFKYIVTNQALGVLGQLFLAFSTDKIVIKFVEKVKEVSESPESH